MAKITKILLFTALLIFGLSSALQALAHGEGASIEQTVGDYFIDVGYDPEEPTTDDSVRLDFAIKNKSTNEEVEFTNIWVRIEQGNKTFFAGSIGRARFGLTGLLYDFGESGDYEIFARFENDEGSIVETSFPLSIKAGEEGGSADGVNPAPAFLAGLILGGLGLLVMNKRKK